MSRWPAEPATTLRISVAAMIVAATQSVFLFNLVWSYYKGPVASGNPWHSTTLEWQTPETPPKHGNWGKDLPEVHRWAYDYNVPGAPEDFIPQNVPDSPSTPVGRAHGVHT